jgi:hypothetical protein
LQRRAWARAKARISVGFELTALLGKAEACVVMSPVRVGLDIGVPLGLELEATDFTIVGFSLNVKVGRAECTSDGLVVGAWVGTEVSDCNCRICTGN